MASPNPRTRRGADLKEQGQRMRSESAATDNGQQNMFGATATHWPEGGQPSTVIAEPGVMPYFDKDLMMSDMGYDPTKPKPVDPRKQGKDDLFNFLFGAPRK